LRTAWRWNWLAVLLAACGSEAARDALPLPQSSGEVRELSEIGHIAEVGEDLVVLTQPVTAEALLLQRSTGRLSRIGRRGAGPGEFLWPAQVLATSDSGFALYDGGRNRMTWFTRTGAFVHDSTLPARLASLGPTFDRQGNALGAALPLGTAGNSSTVTLLWYDAQADAIDSLTTVRPLTRVPVSDDRPGVLAVLQYAPKDVSGILADGTVWVARAEGPKVEWYTRAAGWTSSQHLDLPLHPTTAADQVLEPDLPSRGGRLIPLPMAEVKGPFADALAAEDGEVWLVLHGVAGDTVTRLLAVAPNGAPRAYSIPIDQKLAAVGREWVYLSHEDRDGFTVLEWRRRP
jgi:hypothetical protein